MTPQDYKNLTFTAETHPRPHPPQSAKRDVADAAHRELAAASVFASEARFEVARKMTEV